MGRGQPGEWPLSDAVFKEWAASVPWQDTVSNPTNPHQYTLKRRSPDPRLFELMVLHLRERGGQEVFGGTEYTHLEVGGHKYWTMMSPLEWTILVNRKELPGEVPVRCEREVEQGPRKSREDLPEVYTARYFSENLLASGAVVPVSISLIRPTSLIPLSYPVQHEVRALMPERSMYGEWPKFSPEFWRHLDGVGPESIAGELAAISRRHDGKALALCCYEDLQKGQRCHRAVLSAWWQETTGRAMPELTDDGEVLELHQLHRQVMPLRPR